MSQWTRGKFKHRGPPPALFSNASPAASAISLAGGDNAGGGAAPVGGSSAAGGSTAASSLMPSLPTLQHTTLRLRQEVSNGPGGSSSSGSPSGGAPPSVMHSQKNTGPSDLLQVQKQVGGGGGSGSGGGGSGSSGSGAARSGNPSALAPGKSASGGTAASSSNATGGKASAPPTTAFSLPLPLRHASSTRATDRTDALWAEMQATLEEVELSASEGTRVFGPDHDHKLAALRQAQIALAQAWAQSEADEACGDSGSGGGGGGGGLLSAAEGELSAHNLLKATTTTGTSVSGAGRDDTTSAGGFSKERGGGGMDGSAATLSRDNVDHYGMRPLEEETQVDILLARKRREANDRYFQRVNRGVLDVVAKLEDVADAMRAVEQESMDIWGGDNDSEQPASMT
ncbi:MAG: hypothetical protein STHCBS139747_005797 [Sporothrix thermara]